MYYISTLSTKQFQFLLATSGSYIYQVDLTDDEVLQAVRSGELVVDDSMIVVNENAAEIEEDEDNEDNEDNLPSPSKYPKGYQPVATSECDKMDIIDESDITGLNGMVIQNVNLQKDRSLNKGKKTVSYPQTEVLLDSDRCYNFDRGYRYDKLSNVDPPCYNSVQKIHHHNGLEDNSNSNLNTSTNSAFSPYNNTSCSIPRLKSLEVADSDAPHYSLHRQIETSTNSSPSISRPPLFFTSYPGAVCSFPSKTSCPGMRPGVCGHHPREPCPLTPKNRRQRSHHRRIDRACISGSHNINKVSRMYMEQAIRQQRQQKQHQPDVANISSTKEKARVKCQGGEKVASSQV